MQKHCSFKLLLYLEDSEYIIMQNCARQEDDEPMDFDDGLLLYVIMSSV